MTDTTEVQRFDFNDRDGIFEVVENGDWVRATDYDALAAKLTEVEEDRDDALIALASARKQLERYIGEAEAALPAVYQLGRADGASDFNRGYLIACCNLANLHGVPSMASDVLMEAGINAAVVKRMDLSHYDAAALKEIRTAGPDDPISRKKSVRALPTPTAAELMARIHTGENK